MVTIKQVEQGLARFLDTELMTKLPDVGWQKVLTGTAAGLIIKRMDNIFDSLKKNELIKAMGIVTDNDMIDIDVLWSEFKSNMPDTGLQVEIPMLGKITLSKADIDKLYALITQ